MGWKCEANQLWKAICVMLMICVIALVAILAAMYDGKIQVRGKSGKEEPRKPHVAVDDTCPPGTQDIPPSASNRGIFDELTADELKMVDEYLQKNISNMKSNQEAKMTDPFVHFIEASLPEKNRALAFLDDDGERPNRLAKAYVVRGDRDEPEVEVIEVNLSASPKTHRILETLPFYKCQITAVETNNMVAVVVKALKEIDDILLESFQASPGGCVDGKCLTMTYMGPHGTASGQRKTWMWLMRAMEGEYLQTLGVQVLVHHDGTNTSNWYVSQIYYNGQSFPSVQDLRKQYDNGTVVKIVIPWPGEVSHSTTQRRGPTLPHAEKRPPRMYEPDGHRYTMNGRHVEYMGWSLDFAMRTFNGLQLYNINYLKERIIYEIGFQEMSAFYSGHNPVRMHTNYWDGSYLIGMHQHELVRGVDCPEYASMVDSAHYWEGPRIHKNTVCVFELNTGMPLRRHFTFQYGGGWDVYSGMVDNVLVVRSISAVYNYDYVVDYIFHQGGALEVKWTPTGFVQGAFYTDKEAPYSFQLWKHGSANLHNHVAHMKIDLDVLGTKNSFHTLDIELENITSPYYKGQRHIQKVIKRTKRESERQAALHYNFDKPKFYLINKDNATNEHGEIRGYRISMKGMSKMMYPENWGVEPGAAWARYQISVTKRRENETRSSSPFMQSDPFTPHVSFESFLENDDNIVDEDIVAWVTLGTMHAPRAEDIPITHTTGITGSIAILPFNYFNIDQSMNSHDAVRFTPKVAGKYHTFSIKGLGLQPDNICKPRKFPLMYNGTRFIVN